MGTVPMGTGAFLRIHSRVSWMCLPVDRSMTVSAPHRVDQRSFSTSSSMDEETAEFPMLALIFTLNARPMMVGSSSGWLMLAGMMARPRATSARTNSGSIASRRATNSISGVISPFLAHSIWVMGPAPPFSVRRARVSGISTSGAGARVRPVSCTSRPRIHSSRSEGRPRRTSPPSGPLVSWTRSGGSPPVSWISRMGTRTPREPSTYTFFEFGKAPG